jgi:hypothetical protein
MAFKRCRKVRYVDSVLKENEKDSELMKTVLRQGQCLDGYSCAGPDKSAPLSGEERSGNAFNQTPGARSLIGNDQFGVVFLLFFDVDLIGSELVDVAGLWGLIKQNLKQLEMKVDSVENTTQIQNLKPTRT